VTARTHDLAAFASLVTVAALYPPLVLNLATLFSALIACVIGSLIPDMDQDSNRLWDLLPGGDFLGKIFKKIFLGHRSISHSLLGLFLYYQFFSWLLPKFLNPSFINPGIITSVLMIGLISHLAADSLTEEGIPLLFPFGFKLGLPPIRSWRIKTGGWFEKLIIFPGIVIYLIFFLRSYSDQIIIILKQLHV
jgi:membrane-bound metal-dependent hydrolase YbcI (DUF457 family)